MFFLWHRSRLLEELCEGIGRPELFEKWPGSKYADHAKGNRELHLELKEIFKSKSTDEWLKFSEEENTPIAPVYNAKTAPNDPQFQHRLPFYSVDDLGAEQLPLPVKIIVKTNRYRQKRQMSVNIPSRFLQKYLNMIRVAFLNYVKMGHSAKSLNSVLYF